MKRTNQPFELRWTPEDELNFDVLREQLAAAIEATYTKEANKQLAEIERELKLPEHLTGTRLAFLLFNLAHTRQAFFDQRTHRKLEVLVPRFSWVHLAATYLDKDTQALRDEIVQYWKQSLEQIEPLRGGAAAFNDLLRELMLTVVSTQWVDYLTAMENLRAGIGLQALGQRDPLVEYKRRAFAMFEDLYRRIRSQVVTYVFTYQYRGLARLEGQQRDREVRQAIESQASVVSQPATVSRGQWAAGRRREAGGGRPVESKKPAPARKPVSAPVGTKIGRNDPCWCGSGKKYKNCHMASDNK
jgi:preprotein translocase subunit SecA